MYSKEIERAVDYIKNNIEEQITLAELADYVGYSQYHFLRIFCEQTGKNPIEYVRAEKLSCASNDLFSGLKILDIAVKYGYETASGFSKAFKKEFGYTPTKYISHMARLESKDTYISDRSKKMKFEIIEKGPFKVVGYGIKTNINSENFTKEVAAFWGQYDINGWEEKLYSKLNPPKHGEVGVSASDEAGNLTYVLGVITDSIENVESDMIVVDIPAAKYAVFTTPPVDYSKKNGLEGKKEFEREIKNTWRYIFEKWFKNSGYQYDDSKMDFEYYDERCHFRKDTVMDIYVPVIEK